MLLDLLLLVNLISASLRHVAEGISSHGIVLSSPLNFMSFLDMARSLLHHRHTIIGNDTIRRMIITTTSRSCV